MEFCLLNHIASMDIAKAGHVLDRSPFFGGDLFIPRSVGGIRKCCHWRTVRNAFDKEFVARSTERESSGNGPILRRERRSQWGAGIGADEKWERSGRTNKGIKELAEEANKKKPSNPASLPRKDGVERKLKSSSTKSVGREVSSVNGVPDGRPSCYGCGALLQTLESEAPGYVPLKTFELKKKHHQLKTVLCGRCRLLSQGQMIPAVGGVGGYGSGKGYVPAEQLRAQLSHLGGQKALIVKLVDIVDFNGSFLGRVRDLVGANPIVLIITKADLLPEGTDLGAVSDWLQEAVLRKKLNVTSIHLTSSKAQVGIGRAAADIKRQRLGRDVYILGSANVGKSAFVTALLQELSRRDPVAGAALRFKPIQSAMPGTTLGPIAFQAFPGGGKIYDTPGVHLHHRMAAALDGKDVCLLAPRRRLRGFVVGPPDREEKESEEDGTLFEDIDLDKFLEAKSGGQNWWKENSFPDLEEEEQESEELDESEEEQEDSDDGLWAGTSLVGHTFLWGGVVRIDVLKAPADLKLTFYGPSAIRVVTVPTEEAEDFYKENIGQILQPPSYSTVGQWPGLEKVQEISLIGEELSKQPVGDVAISGLGWFTLGKAGIVGENNEDSKDETPAETKQPAEPAESYNLDEEVIIVLHTPKAVEIYVRPSIPVGRKASSWYDYADLTDEELNARPQVFY